MPANLRALTLTAPGSSAALRNELALILKRANVSTDGGDTELEITREVLTKQTATVDSRAKAAEYTLIYAVDYRVQHTDAKTPGALQSLILRRSYQYDTTNIVGKSTEEETLTHELRQDAAQQIMRQLRTWTPPVASETPAP
jgi:LPS-assembly lipoprotein